MNRDKVASVIKENLGALIDFGDSNCAPSSKKIKETETEIGGSLPPNYIWFLKKYGGGEIGGEEIYSIYSQKHDIPSGDIGYQTKWYREHAFIEDTDIPICSGSFGELCVRLHIK